MLLTKYLFSSFIKKEQYQIRGQEYKIQPDSNYSLLACCKNWFSLVGFPGKQSKANNCTNPALQFNLIQERLFIAIEKTSTL